MKKYFQYIKTVFIILLSLFLFFSYPLNKPIEAVYTCTQTAGQWCSENKCTTGSGSGTCPDSLYCCKYSTLTPRPTATATPKPPTCTYGEWIPESSCGNKCTSITERFYTRTYSPSNCSPLGQISGCFNAAECAPGGCDAKCNKTGSDCSSGLSCQTRGGNDVCWGSSCEPPPPTATPIPTATSVPTATPVPCPKKSQGDANCDGQVNLLDYFYYVTVASGGRVPSSVNPDFNGNGTVNAEDRVIIIGTLRP